MSHVPLRARFRDLMPDEKSALKDWWKQGVCQEGHGKVGLWICGSRMRGTSYIAEVAMGRVVPQTESWDRVDALALVENLRSYWHLSDMVRRNPDDYALFLEMQDIELKMEYLWHECEVLWVDDLHDEAIDIPFWRKHVQPHLERRLKQQMPTVVATTLPPDSVKLSGLQEVIENLFVVCGALTPVSERRTSAPYDSDAER